MLAIIAGGQIVVHFVPIYIVTHAGDGYTPRLLGRESQRGDHGDDCTP